LRSIEIAAYAGRNPGTNSPIAEAELFESTTSPVNFGEYLLAVQYTRGWLITRQAIVNEHFYADEFPHCENFSLVNDLCHERKGYWKSVEEAIQKPVKASNCVAE
jgi:hypothetical protein